MTESKTKGIEDLTRGAGKVGNWKLCKWLKFRHANKWCMYKPESVQENKMYMIN